ncbi:MAG: hypothetical protein OXD34_13990 [bacterium]|nr:hypothetical protein [bacterium]
MKRRWHLTAPAVLAALVALAAVAAADDDWTEVYSAGTFGDWSATVSMPAGATYQYEASMDNSSLTCGGADTMLDLSGTVTPTADCIAWWPMGAGTFRYRVVPAATTSTTSTVNSLPEPPPDSELLAVFAGARDTVRTRGAAPVTVESVALDDGLWRVQVTLKDEAGRWRIPACTGTKWRTNDRREAFTVGEGGCVSPVEVEIRTAQAWRLRFKPLPKE